MKEQAREYTENPLISGFYGQAGNRHSLASDCAAEVTELAVGFRDASPSM